MKKKQVAIVLRLFIACFLTFTSTHVFAQDLRATLEKYATSYQPEKAYLHFDKSAYAPGETIWFKAYLMEGINPSEGSKTFYVDWLDDNGNVLMHSVCPILDATTNGQFDIPENFSGNVVHVRAYTQWMLNFDTAFLFHRDLRIINKNATVKAARVVAATIPSIQFFPEGGDAIAGVWNKIAFKANDQWGRPVKVRGKVVDNKGTVVDTFRAIHDGMGYFSLMPKEGVSYLAKWKDEKGTEHTTAIPEAKSSGVSMQVTVAGTRRTVYLNGSKNIPGQDAQLHLVGTMNQHLVFSTETALTPGESVHKVIPTESLPSGILVITLFDKDWNALAERITFVDNHEYRFEPKMEVQHWGLNKRARDEIKITVPDSLQANLSVSVTDAALAPDSSNTIVSHFLLTSELKGHIYNPSYYFSGTADSIQQHLDLVMLTHGWRRFKWEDVTKGKFPALTYPKDTAYLTLSGKLYGIANGQIGPNDNIVLFVKAKDTTSKMMVMPIERNGSFGDPDFLFFDTLHVYYQIKSKANSGAEANFMTKRLPAPNYTAFSKGFLPGFPSGADTVGSYYHYQLAMEQARLRNAQKGKLLETVTVTAKTKSPVQQLDEKYASGLFQGGDGYQFDLVHDKFQGAYLNVFQYLQGKVAGLQISQNGNNYSLTWRGGAPTLYIDEVPSDASMLSNISVSDIAYVKVFRPPFMGGSGGGNGAIAVYTRKGGDIQATPGKGLANNTIAGYTPVREFYSPNYDTFKPSNEQQDLRTTLYWNPRVVTDPQHHSVILTFYNNDVTQSFRVVIEGMTREGLLAHHEEIME